ncbi:MAG: prepilin-type N-terminal cleavage/methylation domain-containing protein [Candidatus Sumerlaeia bacterium]
MSHIRRAFTLGELIIVLVIIAVLAAIAIPNFLESCSPRSPVSRSHMHMRSLELALESYKVDNGVYPSMNNLREIEQRLLTTPIAYLSELPIDNFREKAGLDDKRYRIYVSTVATSSTTKTKWMVSSIGPDLLANTSGYRSPEDVRANEALPRPAIGVDRDGKVIGSSGYGGLFYDPTNGTKSYGDIYKWGQ